MPRDRAKQAAYIAQWKRTRSPEQRERDTAQMKRAGAARRARIAEFKKRPCADCRVEYPPHVMQFDHRPEEPKRFDIATSINRRWSVILEEIAKCDVVCANCHAERTHQRRST